jgi:pre-mRNA-processing factor 17
MSFDKETFDCFAPKRLIHTWTGHTKGVNSIRFIPKTGHLLLSAAQDQRIKLWNAYGERECTRTFYGHNKPVREVNFSSDGSRFVSCSYDRSYKQWDTETGKCIFGKEYNTIPYCIRTHPDDPNIVLVGTADKKVLQWDVRADELVLEYAQHSSAVNTITFFNGGRNFVTSSDDRTLRVWEYGNGNSVKMISDPEMQSMPFVAHHPTEPFLAFQSLTNQIQIYSLHDLLTPRNKRFIGHSTSGYACQVSFSPDGRFICSGDGRGQVVVWNWQNGQQVRRLDAHPQVCIGVEWNPQHASRMASCSWDGTIKYWE